MNPVDPVGPLDFLAPAQPLSPELAAGPSGSFATMLEQGLSSVNDKLVQSDTHLRALAAGEVDNLHQVMIAMEDAKLSFQFALQVRNRLMEAYQEVLRMQI
ncbi:MAG: flagellar hook-basal body complex protein FliE [Pseudomonadota bacterium]